MNRQQKSAHALQCVSAFLLPAERAATQCHVLSEHLNQREERDLCLSAEGPVNQILGKRTPRRSPFGRNGAEQGYGGSVVRSIDGCA